MGCDIHIYAETRKSKNDPWTKVGAIWPSEYAQYGGEAMTDEPYQGRNYKLFGLLADVRNGRGFAGCDTGNRVEPISQPRGLPDDLSDELRCGIESEDEDDYIYIGDHSFSWLTLAELKDVDWDGGVFTTRGYISREQAEEYRRNDTIPTSWCGETTNPNFVKLEWCMTYQFMLGFFINTTIPRLEALVNEAGNDSNNVRIVFGFDN